jgi:hypothetical protein
MSYKWTGTGSYLDGTLNTALDFDCTFACMAYFETSWASSIVGIATLGYANSSTDNNTLQLRESSSANIIFGRLTDSGGTAYNCADSGHGSTGAWIPVVMTSVKGSANQSADRNIYVVSYANAANESTDLTLSGTLTYLRLGDNFIGDRDWYGGATQPRYLAEVAIWNKVLSQSEIEDYLAKKRVSDGSNGIALANLRAYFPLASNLNKTQGADSIAALSSTGSVAQDALHPTITEWTAKYLKLLCHPSAASASSVAGVVFEPPTGSDITGAKIGEFTAAAFEATTEGAGDAERAVLLVPTADFGGGSLAADDPVVALVRNASYTTGAIDGTVVEV